MSTQNIRNFCIIAHIDHGKSTLADRLLEVTKTVDKVEKAQVLDTMDLEQERGITIKLQPVRMDWTYKGQKYILNLIDTPGHVDFSYEVSRSLAACEGAILVVDATQGIQAQTLANCYMAVESNLTIIPVVNKIDLIAADPDRVKHEIEDVLGIPKEEILEVSAKQGTNIEKILERIVEKVPPPKEKIDDEGAKALIFDSVFDTYRGVVTYLRVMQGELKKKDRITFLHTGKKAEVLEVGHFKLKYEPKESLSSGEVGYIVTGVKNLNEIRVGDTIWQPMGLELDFSQVKPLPGYKKVKPFVFASVYCMNGDDFPLLRVALEKLILNDSSLTYEPEQSGALGHGFRCGFLGLLHLDIVQERLEREYNLSLIITAPSVSYRVVKTGGEEVVIANPVELPDPASIDYIKEPWVNMEVISPKEYLGGIMQLIQSKRGIQKNVHYIENRVIVSAELPLAPIIIDFYDELKSISSGYASMNYEILDYRPGDLVKLDILIAGEKVDALSQIVYEGDARTIGMRLTKKLKEVIPKAQFQIIIQAAIGSRIIARETISALHKDVTAKLYGGDRTRKDKLLKKQKAGKKRMKMVGRVELPQEAFLAIIKKDQ